jgi:hypothetical protein
MLLTTAAPCQAHKFHRPKATYQEAHHVVPQAWQEFWRPDTPVKTHLWHPETVALCPTGHRNVHYFLVQMMHGLPVPRNNEVKIAQQAMTIWVDAGGSLDALRQAKLWGEG